ncbi:energy-converting hydrogenase A subunit A EhaA [Methanobrevibacter sp. DSM 116169]|uniref:energy-converting hydrogenase A subunit A EhaA n=1 Tax=Methanobrevibacter sp. DSM 116169 TaxID=3242727 RepID=UPI0038FBF54F
MIVGINNVDILINYLLAIFISIVVAYLLKVPLLPDKPYRFSFKKSALFPTPIFALGFLSFCFALDFYYILDTHVLGLLIGIFTGFFIKYIFDFLFPGPPETDNGGDAL